LGRLTGLFRAELPLFIGTFSGSVAGGTIVDPLGGAGKRARRECMNKDKVKVEKLNVYGQVCPSTLLLALREVNRLQDELHRGEVQLDIRTDNRFATATIPNAVRNMGLDVKVRKEEEGYLIQVCAGRS
jgi:TusA-related sulfurtransferase